MVYNTCIFDKGIAEESTHMHFGSPFINDTSQIGAEIESCRTAYTWVGFSTQAYAGIQRDSKDPTKLVSELVRSAHP